MQLHTLSHIISHTTTQSRTLTCDHTLSRLPPPPLNTHYHTVMHTVMHTHTLPYYHTITHSHAHTAAPISHTTTLSHTITQSRTHSHPATLYPPPPHQHALHTAAIDYETASRAVSTAADVFCRACAAHNVCCVVARVDGSCFADGRIAGRLCHLQPHVPHTPALKASQRQLQRVG